MILAAFPNKSLRTGIVLASVLILAGTARVAAQETRATPLPEEVFPELNGILETALQQSPTMLLKNIELAQAEAAKMTAFSSLLPNIGTSISYNQSEASVSANTSVSSTSSGLFYSASFTQPIFRWGTLLAANDAAKMQLLITQKNYAEAYRVLAYNLRYSYLGLIAKKIAWKNAESAQERAAYNLSVAEAKLGYGTLSQASMLLPRLALEDAKLATDRATEDFANAKRSLQRLAGLAELADDRIPNEIPTLTYDPSIGAGMLASFLSGTWQQTLAVQAAQGWVKVAQLNYKQAKYRLYPMFSFGASIAQSNSTSASENSVSQVGVLSKYYGLSASWLIFDGRATKAAQISARANQRYYERILENQTNAVMDQARSLEKQVGFSARALRLAETRFAQTESAARLKQDEVKQGLASQYEADNVLALLENSRLTVASQRLDFMARWAEFVSLAAGDPILKNLPPQLKSNVR
jgi:outer membrane protein TolC